MSAFHISSKLFTFGGEIINAGGAGFRKRISTAIGENFSRYYNWIPPPESGLVEGTDEYKAYMVEKLTALKNGFAFCHAEQVSPNIILSHVLR